MKASQLPDFAENLPPIVQARPFYEKFGYEVVADIPDYPKGHSYHALKKSLE